MPWYFLLFSLQLSKWTFTRGSRQRPALGFAGEPMHWHSSHRQPFRSAVRPSYGLLCATCKLGQWKKVFCFLHRCAHLSETVLLVRTAAWHVVLTPAAVCRSQEPYGPDQQLIRKRLLTFLRPGCCKVDWIAKQKWNSYARSLRRRCTSLSPSHTA